jgi:t-SNARE complex subunit (syntaxin)
MDQDQGTDAAARKARKVQWLVVSYVMIVVIFVITNKVNANVYTERYVFFSVSEMIMEYAA